MIYQEPMASLNPAMKVGRQLMEVPMIHEGASAAEARAQALRVVEAVRLPDPERILDSYPHQLSGGQQQRIVIAMALMSKPALLILDEPTTALDVTVEAGIVELVKDLGREFGTSMLFISHNLGLVLETCDRICVMYSGEAVETGPIARGLRRDAPPLHPGAVPLDPAARRRQDTRGRWSRSPATSPCPTSGRRAATSGRAAATSSQGRCDAHGNPDGAGDARPTPRRCIRFDEIDWTAPPPARGRGAGRAARRRGAQRRRPEEILRGRLERALRRRHPGGQGQRGGQLRGARGRDAGHRRRVAAAASRRSPRCCSASRPRPRARSASATTEIGSRADRAARHPHRRLDPDGVPEPVRHAEPQPSASAARSSACWRSSASASTNAEREARMLELLDLVQAAARLRPRGCRASSPAARSSASASPAPSPARRRWWSPTSRSRRSTSRCRRRSPSS